MGISRNIIINLNEKASIDWNNYLTAQEIHDFISGDDKLESASNIINSKAFTKRYHDLHNNLQAKFNNSWNKDELAKDLENFYSNGHLITESNYVDQNKKAFDLWKTQIDSKNNDELRAYLDKQYNTLMKYSSKDLDTFGYRDILRKISYIEDILGVKRKIGRELN